MFRSMPAAVQPTLPIPPIPPGEHNKQYLQTKKTKLGHTL
jgi:GTP cyclohydrolase II